MNRQTLIGMILVLGVLALLLGSAPRPSRSSAEATPAQREAASLVQAAVGGRPAAWRDAAVRAPYRFLRLASE